MPERRRTEIFLSHAARNRAFVERVADALRERGIRSWYSERHIRGAQQWHDEIGAALRRCDWFVVVLSPEAVTSKWVRRELLYALRDDRYQDRIIPLLHRPCDFEQLSWTLPGFQFVRFTRGFEAGCVELFRALRAPHPSPRKRQASGRRRA